jgi:peptidoglycan/xylan/chitin deacetylase (PgdA/CDA1 family)
MLTMRLLKTLLLHLIEYIGGFRLLRHLKKNDPVILMYHRIISNQLINGLTPEEFEQQINYISKHFKVIPIDELINDINQDKVRPHSLALTFDDGHYDFYTNAWPILKKYNLPASIYITTGFIDGTTWLWPDLLKYILINSKIAHIDTAEIGPISTNQEHHRTWHKLGDYCLTLKTEERNQFLLRLARQAQIDLINSPQPPFHSVTWSQLNEMAKDGLNVGSHTVTHPILSSLSREDMFYELGTSAKAIEQNLGTSPDGICYPNGRTEDINEDVIKAVKELGYTYGLMGRNSKLKKKSLFKIGRLAANKNFFYFKWTLAKREQDSTNAYMQ